MRYQNSIINSVKNISQDDEKPFLSDGNIMEPIKIPININLLILDASLTEFAQSMKADKYHLL